VSWFNHSNCAHFSEWWSKEDYKVFALSRVVKVSTLSRVALRDQNDDKASGGKILKAKHLSRMWRQSEMKTFVPAFECSELFTQTITGDEGAQSFAPFWQAEDGGSRDTHTLSIAPLSCLSSFNSSWFLTWKQFTQNVSQNFFPAAATFKLWRQSWN
jgi:hypothetical protein